MALQSPYLITASDPNELKTNSSKLDRVLMCLIAFALLCSACFIVFLYRRVIQKKLAARGIEMITMAEMGDEAV